jgi:hypothetical protein
MCSGKDERLSDQILDICFHSKKIKSSKIIISFGTWNLKKIMVHIPDLFLSQNIP